MPRSSFRNRALPRFPRKVPRFLALALTAAGLTLSVLGQASPAPAAPAHAADGTSLVPTAPGVGSAWIQGLVTDQAGRPQDNVVVEAFEIGEYAKPVASWITYAGPQGGAAHGWYRLYVPGGPEGYYEIRFSSPAGVADPFRTTMYDEVVRAKSTEVVPVETVALARVRRADSSTTVTASKKSGRAGKKGKLTITVTSPDVSVPTGAVKVSVDGKSLGMVRLDASGRGAAKLAKHKPGTYKVKVSYAGADNLLPSKDTLRLKVTKKKKSGHGNSGTRVADRRPNAW